VVLDAGALIAFERYDRGMLLLLNEAVKGDQRFLVPAGVIGQVWRDGRRQARVARLLSSPQVAVVPLDDRHAREAGQLCGVTGTADVIDASVICAARAHKAAVVTSDPDDLRRLDPSVRLIRV
jgi:predicted nucleic acid-binding protein